MRLAYIYVYYIDAYFGATGKNNKSGIGTYEKKNTKKLVIGKGAAAFPGRCLGQGVVGCSSRANKCTG
jgi:hypothetical protein